MVQDLFWHIRYIRMLLHTSLTLKSFFAEFGTTLLLC